METTTAGKNDLEQRNSTLESDFISWMYFKTIIGGVGPRKLYSECNFLLPIQHGMALKGCSSGALHSVIISTVACWFQLMPRAFCVRFSSSFFGCFFWYLVPQSEYWSLKCLPLIVSEWVVRELVYMHMVHGVFLHLAWWLPGMLLSSPAPDLD